MTNINFKNYFKSKIKINKKLKIHNYTNEICIKNKVK